ncbi:MAG: hypothetical protein ACKV2Q_12170 [Planctomycetaceae bacterium]
MSPQIKFGALLIALSVMTLAPCLAEEEIKPEVALADGLERLAKGVVDHFANEKLDKAISVSFFLNADGDQSASLRDMLEAALKKQGFEIRRSMLVIEGRFALISRKKTPAENYEDIALKLTANIRDRLSDEVRQPISIPIHCKELGVHLAGLTVEHGTDPNDQTRAERVCELITRPVASAVANESRAAPDSPFGVEVRVRRGQTKESDARKPQLVEGRSFVKLEKGEEYVVRLFNRASHEAAVTLTIDGLNMFAFSEEGNFGSQVLIPPGHVVEIPGWYINKMKSDAFEITTYAKSAAASRGVTSGVGTITASFSAAWDPESDPPSDESLRGKESGPATGRGRQIDQKYEQVQRKVGLVRSVVSVRYTR